MKEKTAILQQSDRYIMEKLWEKSPMTTIQLYHELKDELGWSKSTVFTLLSRMTEKGIIYYKEDGKAKQYYPAIGKDEAAAAETASLLKRVFKGSAGMMMNTMLKENMFSKDEIDELYDMLKKGK
ncbi:MAG TPA: transcriptional regulator [Lachnospiraceae bacterium]|nr:transcriptional regulator [Lachnospiraceae bacterium]